jgi:putative transposase
MSAFLKGNHGLPKKKKKAGGGSIWLTSELFRFDIGTDRKPRLFIGTKTKHIGYLSFRAHRPFAIPKSLRIKQKNGRYTVSFCYEDVTRIGELTTRGEHLQFLSGMSQSQLNDITVGVDRGVAIPIHIGRRQFDFSPGQKRHKVQCAISIKVLQKKLSRQKMGSNHRRQTKQKMARTHQKVANIRMDFAHQTSHQIVGDPHIKVIVFEDLRTKNLVKAPGPKTDQSGHFVKNGAAAKAGLNKAILDKGWGQIENFCAYKAQREGKAFFKVSASYTSQECADCGHTHPSNRPSQAEFQCESCGHTDNADSNAAAVIKKRAINLILDSGTELSTRGVLTAGRHRARSLRQSEKAIVFSAIGNDVSKMMELGLAA